MALTLLAVAALTASARIAVAASSASSGGSSLKPSDRKARYGKRVRLQGSMSHYPDARVRISFKRAGATAWRTVRYARTDSSGDFSVRVRARASGSYRAKPAGSSSGDGGSAIQSSAAADPSPSPPAHLRVISHTRAHTKRYAVLGHALRVRGRVKPGDAGRRVRVKVGGDRLRDRTDHRGAFAVPWRPRRTGRVRVVVRAGRDPLAAASRDRAGRVTVLRRAVASWYGPGFYGSRTACGKTLEPSTLGVANQTLPCGTRVLLRYHGRQVKVPVIDRGPYAGGRDFDLTEATKQRLRFPSTGTLLSSK